MRNLYFEDYAKIVEIIEVMKNNKQVLGVAKFNCERGIDGINI